MTEEKIKELKNSNYVLVAQPHTNYWFAISSNKMKTTYIDKFGDDFNLIIYSQVDIDENYYVLPYKYIKELLKEVFYSKDTKTNVGKRWVGNIKNHTLKITNNPNSKDIKEFYANPFLLDKINIEDELNDYEIENKKQEINVRINQSKFRKGVLKNFNSVCCITNITEESLLVASHIIPWSDKKETRLDPKNGLCLSVLFDKLFDKGFFTLTNELLIVTIKNIENLSSSLVDILKEIDGKKIKQPTNNIRTEYLEYHRKKIFIERETD
jgi:putative restriction endonuclease